MIEASPCYRCEQRCIGCHSCCLNYKKFRDKKDADNNKINRIKAIECAAIDYEVDKRTRFNLRHKKDGITYGLNC